MKRRDFLKWIGLGVAAVVAAPVLADVAPSDALPYSEFTFRAGDVITIDGQYATHPVTGHQLPYLRQFVVTADCASRDTAALHLHPPVTHDTREAQRLSSRVKSLFCLAPDAA